MIEWAEGSELFVDIWAEEVRRLVPVLAKLRERYEADSREADRGEYWAPDDRKLHEHFRRLWAAQHHLVWAAHQLERWAARLARERGEPVAKADPVLADLRNALEHLDDAQLDDETTVASAGDKGNSSLRRLPGANIRIGPSEAETLFQLLQTAEIERRAWQIATTSDRLDQAVEDWIAEYGPPPPEPPPGVD